MTSDSNHVSIQPSLVFPVEEKFIRKADMKQTYGVSIPTKKITVLPPQEKAWSLRPNLNLFEAQKRASAVHGHKTARAATDCQRPA